MEKSTLYGILIFLVILVAGFIFLRPSTATAINGVNPTVVQGEVQRVVVSQSGYNYNDVSVNAGKPIILNADSSVRGCLRSVAFTINGNRYSKYLKTSEDTLELPALSKGTYSFSCSMGMGYGRLIVE